MKMHFKSLIKSLTTVLVALAGVACANTSGRLPEQQISAIKKASAQQADYLSSLALAFEGEKRNDAWAAPKESELRSSYTAEKGILPGALKSVECRSSKCDVQLQLNADQSPKVLLEQQTAINQWIAMNQPCGYTMTTWPGSQQAPGAIRIFA